MNFVSFPSIEGFHNVVKFVKSYPHHATHPITYRGKIKLHGTNAGIRIKGGEVAAQSRSQIITPTSDNAGFARWVESVKHLWKSLPNDDYTIFGEWCGPGIMKGTAINQIANKAFVIFAIKTKESMICGPDMIRLTLGKALPPDVYVLPWYGDPFVVDFHNEANLRKTADFLNQKVLEVEPCDPWVQETFGINGTAEGIVYYPLSPTYPDSTILPVFENFTFKAKGEKHRVVKVKEAVQVDPEMAENVSQFVSMFVTEARMEQGLAAIGGSLEMKNMGPFLKWLSSDVFKESEDELEASDLTWDQVNKSVQQTARNWFMAKNKSI